MRLDASQGFRGKVLDLDTGKLVPKVRWLDGEIAPFLYTLLEAFRVDADGREVRDGNKLLTYTAKGRFRWTPGGVSCEARMGAPSCAKCSSTLTLPGDDLCYRCRAAERGRAVAVRIPYVGKCCRCSRLAVWCVADEAPASPAAVKGVLRAGNLLIRNPLYEQGAVVNRRLYCSWHFQPPRLLDAKGEVMCEARDIGPE